MAAISLGGVAARAFAVPSRLGALALLPALARLAFARRLGCRLPQDRGAA
jgi:hypothetical protein